MMAMHETQEAIPMAREWKEGLQTLTRLHIV